MYTVKIDKRNHEMKKRTTLGGSVPRVPEIQLLRICLSEMTPNSPSISCHLLHLFFFFFAMVRKGL